MSKAVTTRIGNLVRWLGQVVLIVLVSYGIVRALAPELSKVSLQDFAQWRPRTGPLAVSLLMLIAVYLAHCMLWRHITTRLGGIKPGLKSALRIYFVSSLGRYLPGKLWQIAGLAVLAQKAGISAVAATAASLVAQFAFLTAGLVYLALLLPGWGGNAPIVGALITLVLGAASFFVITSTRLGHNLREAVSRRSTRFGNALMMLDRVRIADALVWWVLYALTWALLGAAFVVMTSSFVPLTSVQQLHVAGTAAASYLFGYVAFFSLAGLGVREAVMIGLLSQVMPASAALVVSVVSRLWFTAAELLPLALIPAARDRER